MAVSHGIVFDGRTLAVNFVMLGTLSKLTQDYYRFIEADYVAVGRTLPPGMGASGLAILSAHP